MRINNTLRIMKKHRQRMIKLPLFMLIQYISINSADVFNLYLMLAAFVSYHSRVLLTLQFTNYNYIKQHVVKPIQVFVYATIL